MPWPLYTQDKTLVPIHTLVGGKRERIVTSPENSAVR